VKKISDLYLSSNVKKIEILFVAGMLKEAEITLEKLSKNYPSNQDIYIIWADLLRIDKQFLQAKDLYSRIIDSYEEITKENANLLFSRAICYKELGEWERAEADLELAVKFLPNNPDLLNYLGYSWIARDKNIVRAKEMLVVAVMSRPGDPNIIDSVGWAMYKMGELDLAARFLEKAAEYVPYSPTINNHLGDVYWQQGRFIEARFQWNRVLQYSSEDTENISAVDVKGKVKYGMVQ